MFRINRIGLAARHPGDFGIDRPEGSGDCLLIIFKTDALLRLRGEDIPVRPDSAVIFSEGSPQQYRAVCGSYVNHFLHFSCSGEDIRGLGDAVRFDELLPPGAIHEAEELLRMLSLEQMSESASRELCVDMLIRLLLIKLSERSARPSERRGSVHAEMLSELRAELHSNAGEFGSVAQLAGKANLSPSHFQQLYKQQFGVSCYEDLLTAKINTAQYYLGTTVLTVKEIAAICGYDNEVVFMHGFKRRTGMTPSEYRSRVRG
ncbi:MAG: helix-turn-helix transcriptional regulator [Ruminococcus sp.]|nr:helix-turn-helix transcriptional regulator [Ruminococcus sp.]